MNRQEINNNRILKAKYYGFSENNIITKHVLGGLNTTQGKKIQRVGNVCSVRPARNKKRGAE